MTISLKGAAQLLANQIEFDSNGYPTIATLHQVYQNADKIQTAIASAIHWKAYLTYIPGISTFSGAYNLATKKIVCIKRELIGMFPFIGNFIVYRMDQQRIRTLEADQKRKRIQKMNFGTFGTFNNYWIDDNIQRDANFTEKTNRLGKINSTWLEELIKSFRR